MNSKLLFLAAAMAALAGCQKGGEQVAAQIDQDTICETSSWRIDGDCKPGTKIAFLPQRWGNEQLPVMFAAANCDMRYSVLHTNGGVVCIFKPLAPGKAAAPASAASGS